MLRLAEQSVNTADPVDARGSEPDVRGLPDVVRAGFEWLPIGVLMTTAEGTVVLVNRALERLVGYSSPELIGQPVDILVPEALRAEHAAFRQGFMARPRARRMGAGRDLFARRKDGSETPIEVGLAPIRLGERWFVLAWIVDLSERLENEAAWRRALDERLEIDAVVAELGAQFVSARPDEVDFMIEEALGRLARALHLDRSAIFQVVEDTGDFVQTHQWARPGWPPRPPRISAREQLPWHLSRILAGQLISFTAADDIPDAVDRESIRRLGTRSGVTVPLVIGARPWGAMMFATVGEPRVWTSEVVSRLRVVAQLVANVLGRQKSDEALRRAMADHAQLRERVQEENAYLRRQLNTMIGTSTIVGNSPGFRRVLEQARELAPGDAPVLLLGETGTGKSLLASHIHDLSPRRDRAMVRLNCASLSVDSIEGRSAGTYLEGEAQLAGVLELANGSTVYLDEVADLELDAQASLARVLEHRETQPSDSAAPVSVHVRLIAASRRDLAALVSQGLFRDDLYSLLHESPILIPPLRERPEDTPLLVWRFVDEFSQAYGKTIDTIDRESMTRLQRYKWPGNARELRNLIERAMIAATGRRLRISVPAEAITATRGRATLAALERTHIIATLAACGGKISGKTGAAARLGLRPRALAAKLKQLRIRQPAR
jgi:PAS domain S-box-containing protein